MIEQDHRFWVAVVGAAIFKIVGSAYQSIPKAIITVTVALYCAYLFTDIALHALGWNDSYSPIVGGLLALTGEGIMRWVMSLTPERMLALWKEWRK